MNLAVSVSRLHEQLGERLELSWLAPSIGRSREIHGARKGRKPVPLVGYLNFIHPPQVQVIGAAELEFLSALDEPERSDTLRNALRKDTAMLIVGDDAEAEPSIVEQVHGAGIPLFRSTQPGHRLVYELRHYFNDVLAPRETRHGVFVEIHGVGVLITGPSGVGKSELALELISRGHRLVADDAPEFMRVGPDVVDGVCPEALQDFLEVRGLGLLNIRAMFSENAIKRRKKLSLIINLVVPDGKAIPHGDRLAGSRRSNTVLDVPVPEITLPVAVGHNLAVLVETACRDHILREQGYEADQDFAERHERHLTDDES